MEKYGTADSQQMTVWRMRIACCIPEATHKHSQYVTLIAFPLQQWLHERPSVLRYTYIASIAKRLINQKF